MTSLEVTTGAGSQLSVAVPEPVLAGAVLSVHSIVVFGGHVIDGGLLSSTVTVCKHVLLFPQASVASQVLVIVYSCGQAPAAVTSLEVTTGAGSQLSVALARPVLAGAVLSVHSMVTLAGHEVITGGVLSSTVMIWRHVLLFPQASVAIQVLLMVSS